VVSRKSGGELALKFYFQPKTLQKTIKDLFKPSNNPKTTQNYKKKKKQKSNEFKNPNETQFAISAIFKGKKHP